MSHFDGLVFLRPDADLDETLAPYDEQGKKYMQFIDETDKVKEEWEKLPDSFPAKEERWKYEPSKEKYPSFTDYAENYHCYHEVNGRYGYMSNPNAKYDWYSEGGKWDGFLCLKTGSTANVVMLTEVDWERTDIPFCFVDTEGEWHEKGEMGWFDEVTNAKKQEDWDSEFKSYVENLLKDEQAHEIKVCIIDFHN